MVCFGFPLAWVRGPWEPENEHKSVKYSSQGWFCFLSPSFSLGRQVYFTFQSPLLFPTRSFLCHAKLWRKRSNTGNQETPQHSGFFATGWTELRGKAGHGSRAHKLTNTQTHTSDGLSGTFIPSLIITKASYLWLLFTGWPLTLLPRLSFNLNKCNLRVSI